MSKALAAVLLVIAFGLGGTAAYLAFAPPPVPERLDECLAIGLRSDHPVEIQHACEALFAAKKAQAEAHRQTAVANLGAQFGEVLQPGTNLYWLPCPVGRTRHDSQCEGEVSYVYVTGVSKACPSFYRLPTREEFAGLLGNCEKTGRVHQCNACWQSLQCSALFMEDNERYWAAPSPGDTMGTWFVEFDSGHMAEPPQKAEYAVRCVRSGL